jgi:hypothetical protein
MSKVAAIVGFCLVALLVLSGGAVSAQTRKGPPRAMRFDQFERVGHCELGARLDNFAIQLQNQPSAKGAIVSYAPEGDGPGTGKQVLELIKDYLVNTRGLAADRIETIYAGRYLNLYQSHTELWVMPQGAQPPKIVKHTSPVESFQGLYIDEVRHDDFLFEFSEDIEEMGPGIGNSSDASFADILHQQKNAVAYVVVYDGDDLTPGAWRRLGQRDIDKFKEFNVEPSRFKLVLGGHKSLTHIQHWIFPDTAPPPVADVGSEKAFAKTIKAGDFNVYDLTEKNQASIYSRLSEILTLDKTVRAFLIVRLEEPESEEATETVEQSSPAVDLAKLVEKWRVDLATTHKIGPDRLIIVYSSEPSPSTLSLWFIPKGAPLPNPNENNKEEP